MNSDDSWASGNISGDIIEPIDMQWHSEFAARPENTSGIGVLLLDYGGVCTPSPEEFVAALGQDQDFSPVAIHDITRPECHSVVTQARTAGICVAILSNEINPKWADSVELLASVDHIIACSDNGVLKPDRRAYQRALMLTDSSAEQVLFVDDEPDNVAGARAVGIEALLFDTDRAADCWAEIAQRLELS